MPFRIVWAGFQCTDQSKAQERDQRHRPKPPRRWPSPALRLRGTTADHARWRPSTSASCHPLAPRSIKASCLRSCSEDSIGRATVMGLITPTSHTKTSLVPFRFATSSSFRCKHQSESHSTHYLHRRVSKDFFANTVLPPWCTGSFPRPLHLCCQTETPPFRFPDPGLAHCIAVANLSDRCTAPWGPSQRLKSCSTPTERPFCSPVYFAPSLPSLSPFAPVPLRHAHGLLPCGSVAIAGGRC